jgi:hypothetical protein
MIFKSIDLNKEQRKSTVAFYKATANTIAKQGATNAPC